MLQRILEPEVMDSEQDAREYDAMDFVEANTRFADDALALLGARGGEVLDIGAGTGQIPITMCQHSAQVRIVAIDLAHHMLALAERNASRAGVSSRVSFQFADAKKLPYANGRFDMVVANSVHHHIPDPAIVTREMLRVLRPGGALLLRDLIRPESMDAAWSIVRRVAAGEGRRQQQLFFDSLCAALTLDEVQRMMLACRVTDARIGTSSDRHWSVERAARATTRPRSLPPTRG